MVSTNILKYILLLLAGMLTIVNIRAQDSIVPQNFQYVVLHPDPKNNAAPDYQKFRENLEGGLKDLLTRCKVPMLKYQKEAAEKKLQDCDTLTCKYFIEYSQGMMLNAKIKCSLTFTDCRKKEIYSISENKMTGAVAGADAYIKVFAKLITADLMKHLTAARYPIARRG